MRLTGTYEEGFTLALEEGDTNTSNWLPIGMAGDVVKESFRKFFLTLSRPQLYQVKDNVSVQPEFVAARDGQKLNVNQMFQGMLLEKLEVR